MTLPKLTIGDLVADVPIIQGAMGIGVSGCNLAGAVASQGGVGVISGANTGYREPDFRKKPLETNLRTLKSEIRRAKEIAPNGIIGVNLMVAANSYDDLVQASLEAGVDLIISGAGLPMNLPGLVKGTNTKLAPIVSSAKAAKVILRYWDSHYNQAADMIVVEGPEAGGHLGYSEELLLDPSRPSVLEITKEVIAAIKPYEEKFGKAIPVITAGGVFSGADIAECLSIGAAGVQMATRFVATDECDADIKFKQAYIEATESDITIIKSPVGMPGRALNNAFIKKVAEQGDDIKGCLACLQGCKPSTAPYCISTALINAVTGNIDEGLVFVGSNAYRIEKIVSVKELMEELVQGAQQALDALEPSVAPAS